MTTTDELVRTAFTIDDELDDIRRAQAWSRIETRLGGDTARALAVARSRARWSVGVAVGIGAMAAAAAIALLVRTPAAGTKSFVAPAETTLALHVDDTTRAMLVGPAELVPIEHSATTTVVRLRHGTFLGEFEGGHGRELHILAPGAVIEIVGTLFAVEARSDATCVSVSHGTVKMTTAARVRFVTGGQRACSDEIVAEPIAPAMQDALARHETGAVAVAVAKPIVTPILPTPTPTRVAVSAPLPTPIATPTRIAIPTRIATPIPPPIPTPTPTPIPTPTPTPIPTPTPTPIPTPTPTPTPTPVDADTLYADAERALAARDPVQADRALAKLVVEFPATKLLDQAYYERARIAFDRGAWADAQRDLDKLAQLGDSPLAEPGAYLSCRIAIAAHDGAAADCFTDYRAHYPRSPHDREALGALVTLAFEAGGCARAKLFVDELATRYRDDALAKSWSAKCR